MKKSFAVLGLGKYGMSLAKVLYEMGMDVLAVDKDEEKVKEISEFSTAAVCMDLSIEEDIASLDLKSMDIVVVAMGRNLGASIMCVAVSNELGVPRIIAKSSSERMSAILKKIGADKVIVPEEESGMRSARILMSDSVFDYFQVDENLSMIEIMPKDKWVGKSLLELNLRKSYRINIVAKKEENGSWEFIDANEKLSPTCKLLVVIDKNELKKFYS